MANCSQWPEGVEGEGVGNTVQCRIYHLAAAATAPIAFPLDESYAANRDLGASHCGHAKSSLCASNGVDMTYRYPQSTQMCVATAVSSAPAGVAFARVVSASACVVTAGSAHATGGGRRLNRLALAPFGRFSPLPTPLVGAPEPAEDEDAREDDTAGRPATRRTARIAPSARPSLETREGRAPRVARLTPGGPTDSATDAIDNGCETTLCAASPANQNRGWDFGIWDDGG